MEQREEDWFKARLGKVTASRVADVLAMTKSGYAASRKNYMMQLLCERLTGSREEVFTSGAMQWGIDKEPAARHMYCFMQDCDVEETGLVDHPTIGMFAASPDGLVGDDGLIEIKCPNTAQHVDFLRTGKIPKKYETQMMAQISCAQRQWCDYVSFDPRLPERLQYKCVRFEPEKEAIEDMELEIAAFLTELDAIIKDIGEE